MTAAITTVPLQVRLCPDPGPPACAADDDAGRNEADTDGDTESLARGRILDSIDRSIAIRSASPTYGSDTQRETVVACPRPRVMSIDEQRWRAAPDKHEQATGPGPGPGGSGESRHGRMGRCVAVSRSGRSALPGPSGVRPGTRPARFRLARKGHVRTLLMT